MTAELGGLPAAAGATVFAGMQVAATAGWRLVPGSARSRFDQDVWDLTGLADAPVVMGNHRKILDFTVIANPLWRTVAREYLFARIAPHLPVVATLPQAVRSPMNPNTLWAELKALSGWMNHLTAAGRRSLREVSQADCDAYLSSASRSILDPGRRLSPATTVSAVRVCQHLARYGDVLSDAYPPGFLPWAGRSPDTVTGYIRTSHNRVPPVPDDLLQPLLAGCLYLVNMIGPLIAAEVEQARANDRREAESRRGLTSAEVPVLRAAIGQWHAEGRPPPRAGTPAIAHRLALGWSADDPLLQLAFHPLVVEACAAMGHRRHLETLRPELESWVRDCPVQYPYARHAASVPRADDATPTPWTLPVSRHQLDTAAYAVGSAAYFLTSALTGMRASELAELTAGCRARDTTPGGAVRHRLVSRRIKGLPYGGTDDQWVVIADVHDAIAVAEAVTGLPDGRPLFAKQSNNSNSRITGLRAWIDSPAGQRLGLQPIPAGPINPRSLRRTLAMTIAQRPHGLMAARIHLKHISVATTEGYTATPGGHQAAFLADVSAEEQAEHLRLTTAAYDDYQRGILPAGQGARDLIAVFKAVDHALDQHDSASVTVIDDRRAERILKTKAATLHVGPGNYCWFSDPTKALCLRLAQTPEATEPLLGMCDSARCSQATHHTTHRDVWADHAHTTRTVFLGNPRISPLERARAAAAVQRADRVIAEIDRATGSEPT